MYVYRERFRVIRKKKKKKNIYIYIYIGEFLNTVEYQSNESKLDGKCTN